MICPVTRIVQPEADTQPGLSRRPEVEAPTDR